MKLTLKEKLNSASQSVSSRTSQFKATAKMKSDAFKEHMAQSGCKEYFTTHDDVDEAVVGLSKILGGLATAAASVVGLVFSVKLAFFAYAVTGSVFIAVLNFVWYNFLGGLVALGAGVIVGVSTYGVWYVGSRGINVAVEAYKGLKKSAPNTIDVEAEDAPTDPPAESKNWDPWNAHSRAAAGASS